MRYNGYPKAETQPVVCVATGEELPQTMFISRAVALGAALLRPRQQAEIEEPGAIIDQSRAA